MYKTIWDILGIEETKDKKKIKIAYAKKSKNVHPEEDPEGFQVLYNAYKTAILFSKEVSRVDVIEIVEPVRYDKYGFDEAIEKQEQIYKESINWIFDKLNYMMQSRKYEDWHDDSLWETIIESKEFNEYKYAESFIDTFIPYIINNDRLLIKYLDMIYKGYAFDKVNKNTIDDLLYPLYLYLNDQLYGFVDIANTCTKRLWYLTGASAILFFLHINRVFFVFVCSIAFVCEQLFYQVPKYKKQETFSDNIYHMIRESYLLVLFQMSIQYTFVVIRFPNFKIMPITLVILTTVGLVFSVIKKYKNPEITEFYYQLLFLGLSIWAFILGNKELMYGIAIVSNISLLLVYFKWIIGYLKSQVRCISVRGICIMFSMHYITILIQYVLLMI